MDTSSESGKDEILAAFQRYLEQTQSRPNGSPSPPAQPAGLDFSRFAGHAKPRSPGDADGILSIWTAGERVRLV